MRTLSECDAVHDVIRLVVNQFQLDMFLVASHYFAGSVVIDVMRTEDRFDIVRTERIEFLQVIEEFRCDVSERRWFVPAEYVVTHILQIVG